MSDSLVSRREAIAALAAAAALPLVPGCTREPAPVAPAATTTDADALARLDEIAESYLRLSPESATQLGIDTGARAALRSQLFDRSEEGRQRIAAQVRADLERANALNVDRLSYAARTSVEVVRSAYATALEGLDLPYGDTTVGGWRNTPYTVIQNVGAYLDVPRSLDADHPIENAGDAEAYLARLQSYAKQLDGETGRMQAARGLGLIPPAFLLDKALGANSSVGEERTRRRFAGRVHRTADEEHPGQLGRARTRHCQARRRPGARSTDCGARGRAEGRDQ